MGLLFALVIFFFAAALPAVAQVDTTPPVLVGFDFQPPRIDTTSGPASWAVSFHITDDLSGVSGGSVEFVSPSGQRQYTVSTDTLLSGNALDGTYQGPGYLPQFTEPGTWTAGNLGVSDRAGNYRVYQTADLRALGFPTTLIVTSLVDTTLPTLVGFDFSPRQIDTISGPASWAVSFHITDDLSGVSGGSVEFVSPSGQRQYTVSTDTLLSGDALDGTYQGPGYLPQFTEPGTWTAGNLGVSDRAGNYRVYQTADLQALGFPTTLINGPTKSSTNVAMSSSLSPSAFNQPVVFTAIVSSSAGTPTGTVNFTADGSDIGSGALDGSGAATLSVSSLTAGPHTIVANYAGDATFDSSSSSLAQTVNQATTTTTAVSSLNPSLVAQSVLFTATVAGAFGGTPTGTVTFYAGSDTLGTAALSGGQASLAYAFPTVGTRSITAVYSGDSNFIASASTGFNQVVNKATTTTTLVSSLNPSIYGQSVTFTATVSSSIGPPANGEIVTFKDGLFTLGSGPLNGGTATFTTTALIAITHSIKASYGGDANLISSSSPALNQVVSKAATTTLLVSSLNPSTYGKRVTFTATATGQFGGSPAGVVTFKDGSKCIGVAIMLNGVGTYSTSSLTKGSHVITAEYSGLVNFTASSATLTQVVK